MARKKRAAKWTVEEARAELDRWSRSGQTLSQYGRERGLANQRLSYWRKRLAELDRRSDRKTSKGDETRLVPAVLVTRDAAVLRLKMPETGVEVEVAQPDAVSPAWIGQLAHALWDKP